MTEQALAPPMHSASLGKLAGALAKAQATFDPIERTKTVKVTSEKGSYSFDYAPLDTVLEAVRPALAANDLALTQVIVPGASGLSLRTLLLHSSGEWLAAEVSLGQRPAKAQELGSLLTYLRRYSIVSILGVATEEDDDANAADGNHATTTGRRPRPVDDAKSRAQRAAARAEKLDQAAPAPAPLTVAERAAIELIASELEAITIAAQLEEWRNGPGARAKEGSPAFQAETKALYVAAYKRIHQGAAA